MHFSLPLLLVNSADFFWQAAIWLVVFVLLAGQLWWIWGFWGVERQPHKAISFAAAVVALVLISYGLATLSLTEQAKSCARIAQRS